MIAVLASAGGALLAWAPTVGALPSPPANSVIVERAAWDAPPPLPYVWTPSALDWIVPPPEAVSWSPQEFMDRFPSAILTMIHTHSVRDSAVGAAIRQALLRYQVVPIIYRDDPRTLAAVTDIVGLAVALSIVAANDAEATIAEILG